MRTKAFLVLAMLVVLAGSLKAGELTTEVQAVTPIGPGVELYTLEDFGSWNGAAANFVASGGAAFPYPTGDAVVPFLTIRVAISPLPTTPSSSRFTFEVFRNPIDAVVRAMAIGPKARIWTSPAGNFLVLYRRR